MDSLSFNFRRFGIVAAILWWASIVVFLPFGRSVTDALRTRGMLTTVVTLGFVLIALLSAGIVAVLRRANVLSVRQTIVGLVFMAFLIFLVQWWPRPEERWHVAQYGVLGIIVWTGLSCRGWKRWALAVMITGACGWTDEIIQLFIPNRVYDLRDVALNAASGFLGSGIGYLGTVTGARAVKERE